MASIGSTVEERLDDSPQSTLRKLQACLTIFAWCSFAAIPFGVGVMAIRHNVWETLWFVVFAMAIGAVFSTLRMVNRWKGTSRSPILIAFVLLGIGVAWHRSIYLLPFAVFAAGLIYWVGTKKLWNWALNCGGVWPYAPLEIDSFKKKATVGSIRLGIFVLTIVTVIQIARLSLFMVDPTFKPGWPAPYAKELDNHQCLIAYVHAAALNEQGVEDLYNPAWYDPNLKSNSFSNPKAEAKPILAGSDGRLRDVWQYPPQALLLPQIGVAVTHSYPMLRTGWFVIQSILLMVLLLLIVRSLKRSSPAFILLPLLWCASPFVTNLIFGQPHFLVLCTAAYAAILFHQGRDITGGVFLAFAVSMKLFPAFLGLWLLFHKQYRAVAWTLIFSIALVLITLPIVGVTPYEAFFKDQLFRILGGNAWNNYLGGDLFGSGQYTIYGIFLSLRHWGGHRILTAAAPYALLVYTVSVVGVIWKSAKCSDSPLAGFALVNLAAMIGYYSPPEYAAVGVTTLMLMVTSIRGKTGSNTLVPLLLCGFFSIAASPGSLPKLWRYPTLLEVIYVLAFITSVFINSYVAIRPPSMGLQGTVDD